MSKKISVVVPVYNAEAYIAELIESVLAQTYTEWEMLLVENGSEDNSFRICQEYAQKYENISVIQESKKGPGEARNIGMKHTKGEYIFFADADDYLAEATIFSDFMKVAESTNVDIVVCNYKRLWNGKLLTAESHDAFSKFSPDSEEFRYRGFFSVGSLSYVWNKLYKRAFLIEHQLTFSKYDYAEDKLFNMQCYMSGAVYAFLAKTGYIYRKNEQSISHQPQNELDTCWLDIGHEMKDWIQTKCEEGLFTERKEDYERMIAYTLFFASFFKSKMEYMKSKKRRVKVVRKILKQYGTDSLAKRCYENLYKEKKANLPSQFLWRWMIKGFSFFMNKGCYFLLAVGIKILIDAKIDEMLSDTGLRN